MTTSVALAVTATGPNDELKKHLFTAVLLVIKASHIDQLEVVICTICISQLNKRLKI